MNLDILIPSHGHPERLATAIQCAQDWSAGAGIIVIGEPGDPETRAVALECGVRYMNRVGSSIYPSAVNTGARASSADWVFTGADDLQWTPGWLLPLYPLMADPTIHVIAVNDMHNPAVMAGTDGTHFMVRRSYAMHTGATWDDGPGFVMHEGYNHYGPDNELTEVAKLRGCFSPCLKSIVYHHQDDAAKLVHPTRQQDKAYFKQRRRLWLK